VEAELRSRFEDVVDAPGPAKWRPLDEFLPQARERLTARANMEAALRRSSEQQRVEEATHAPEVALHERDAEVKRAQAQIEALEREHAALRTPHETKIAALIDALRQARSELSAKRRAAAAELRAQAEDPAGHLRRDTQLALTSDGATNGQNP
jgi:chromosome segregation ATPase